MILLAISPEWVSAIVASIGLIGLWPFIAKILKERKIPKKVKQLREMEIRQVEVRPNFHIFKLSNNANEKSIQLINEGSKASGIILVGIQTQLSYSLIQDKFEVEKGEVINIYLGDNFTLPPNLRMQIIIGYADIEGRRYQQSYSRFNNLSEISTPQLLVTRK